MVQTMGRNLKILNEPNFCTLLLEAEPVFEAIADNNQIRVNLKVVESFRLRKVFKPEQIRNVTITRVSTASADGPT